MKSIRHALDTAGAVIDALGGTKKVAELCGIGLPAVSVWRAEGFPTARHFQISEECKRRRIKVDRPAVFVAPSPR